ncbi:MAG: LytTR family DNA-binding domain-containing protein [Cyclobacteriaceae bacterium]
MLNQKKIGGYLSEEVAVLNRKEKIFLILSTGIFVFLFLLFFQPFGVNNYDPKETITPLFFGAMLLIGLTISLLIAFNEFLIFPLVVRQYSRKNMLIWTVWSVTWLSSGVFLLYNFLGNWHDFLWSSYFQFIGNLAFVSSIPLSGILIYVHVRELKTSLNEAHSYSHRAEDGDRLIVLSAENDKDQITIPLKYLIYLESEDNYIAIHYLKNDAIAKTLIRKSLKSVQEESHNPVLIRCHRSFMINLIHLQKIQGNRNKMKLYLNHTPHPLPVSRQYTEYIYQLIRE